MNMLAIPSPGVENGMLMHIIHHKVGQDLSIATMDVDNDIRHGGISFLFFSFFIMVLS